MSRDTNPHRRTLLKGTLAGSALVLAATAGLLKPTRVLAAEWPKGAFEAKSIDAVLKDLYGASEVTDGGKQITIKAPIQAENGAVVPISIQTSLGNVQSIGIVVKENATPLIASVSLANNAAGYFSARMKMAKTSDVQVVVKAGGKLYTASQQVKVTVGGCGG